MVQPDVDLEVDSPAHSFLRLVTPGKLHWPMAGAARFGKCAILPDDTTQPSGDIKKSDERPYEQKSVATEGQNVLEFLFLKFRLEEEHF